MWILHPGHDHECYRPITSNPEPTRQEVIDAMEDNLCRCGAHIRIIEAIQSAGQEMKKMSSHEEKHQISGTGDHQEPPRSQKKRLLYLLGGGIAVFLSSRNPKESLALPLVQQREVPEDFNAFLTIHEDGTVICHVGKIEMGQGPITSLPQQVADELDVDIKSIKMVMGDTAICSYDAGTWGSLTTREYSHYLRAACAEARAVLVQLAARHLNIKPENTKVKDGFVFDATNPELKIDYGWLTKGERLERLAGEKPKVKDHTQFHYVGQSFLHADARLKVTGEAAYTADIPAEGRVYAKILRPPSHHVKLLSVDYSEAEKMDGVEVVRDGDLIAVLHIFPDKAEAALATIKAEYSADENKVDDNSIFDHLLNAQGDTREREKEGDLAEGEKLADYIVESEFHDGYKAHAPIETHSALAIWEGDKVTVWASAQSPFGAQDEIAQELGMALEEVRVISPFVGGGFGGKIYHPQALEAVKIAKIARKPVLLVYTREEEFFMDYFRSAAVIKIKSGVTKTGLITMWDYKHYFFEARGSDTIYNVPHKLTRFQ